MPNDTMVKIVKGFVEGLTGKPTPGTKSPLDPDFKGTFTKENTPAGEDKKLDKSHPESVQMGMSRG